MKIEKMQTTIEAQGFNLESSDYNGDGREELFVSVVDIANAEEGQKWEVRHSGNSYRDCTNYHSVEVVKKFNNSAIVREVEEATGSYPNYEDWETEVFHVVKW